MTITRGLQLLPGTTMPPKKKQKAAKAKESANDKAIAETKIPAEVKVVVKQERAPNYSKTEDELLCRAYVNITTDPTVGTDQTSTTFWQRIKDKFDLLRDGKENVKDRSWDSLRNRFQKTIQPEMNYFNRYFKQVKEEKPSGVPESHYPEIAADRFKEEKKRKFKHLHCIEILQQLPKFDPMVEDEVIEIDDDDDDASKMTSASMVNKVGKPMGSDLERPMGSKKAKKQHKDENSSVQVQQERNAVRSNCLQQSRAN